MRASDSLVVRKDRRDEWQSRGFPCYGFAPTEYGQPSSRRNGALRQNESAFRNFQANVTRMTHTQPELDSFASQARITVQVQLSFTDSRSFVVELRAPLCMNCRKKKKLFFDCRYAYGSLKMNPKTFEAARACTEWRDLRDLKEIGHKIVQHCVTQLLLTISPVFSPP